MSDTAKLIAQAREVADAANEALNASILLIGVLADALEAAEAERDEAYLDARTWMEKCEAAEAERDRLRKALKEACGLVDGLAEQQAMADDWYVEPLARCRAALAGGGDE